MNFSVAGCGFLGIYHIGVASCLKQHAPHLLESAKFAGASAGAIVSCCLICDCCLGQCTSFTLKLASKARSRSLGPLHPSFHISKILRLALREILPENAHKIASGRLFISLTRVSDKKSVLVSDYASKEELIQALLCSAHVPFYSGFLPPSFRGVRYVDGGLSDNLPILNDHTITVSPFAGESDICPEDNSSNYFQINLVNTSMQITVGNLYRLSRALFPPHPEILSDMCKQGFDDCLVFLQKNNLISCTRHLSVMSTITPVLKPEKMDVVVENSEGEEEDTCDAAAHHHPGEDEPCEECKKKLQVALIDTLPPKVVAALQTACESVNNGVSFYFHKYTSLKVLSLLVTPWLLPFDLVYNFCVRFLDYLPSLPEDAQQLSKEIVHFVKHSVYQHRKKYTARFTCQLAISEYNYDIDKPVAKTMYSPFRPQPTQPVVRNLNIGFAVDFETDVSNTMKSLRCLENKMEHLDIAQVELQSSRPGQSVIIQTDPHHLKDKNIDCSQLFDTFEQCLHVSNEMESAMAYYYKDESDKQCYNFQEIFNLNNMEINLPDPMQQKQNSSATESEIDLSWDDFMELKPEIETELEELIDSALSLPEHGVSFEIGE
ncbi:hypothetical protein ScPMuIL_015463 [Solemya velum]